MAANGALTSLDVRSNNKCSNNMQATALCSSQPLSSATSR